MWNKKIFSAVFMILAFFLIITVVKAQSFYDWIKNLFFHSSRQVVTGGVSSLSQKNCGVYTDINSCINAGCWWYVCPFPFLHWGCFEGGYCNLGCECPHCIIHEDCYKACTDLCPHVIGGGCCYGCKIGQCINGYCQCVEAVEYCSRPDVIHVGNIPCTSTTTTIPQTYNPCSSSYVCISSNSVADFCQGCGYGGLDCDCQAQTTACNQNGHNYCCKCVPFSTTTTTLSYCDQLHKLIITAYDSSCGNTAYDPRADLNKDGSVNYQDLAIWSANSNNQAFCQQMLTDKTNPCTTTTSTTTTLPVDDPCDNSGTWRKYSIYCCEEDCSKDITKIRGFCLDKATYENNKDKLKLVKEGSNENCVSCTKEECCHELRSFCYDYSSTSPTGCEGDAGIVTLKCSSAGGNTCDYKQNLGGCTLKESGSKLGLLYCANCQAPPPPSTTTTTKPTTTTSSTTTSSTTTTTTTTLPPMPVIQCQECYARSKCECSLTTPCNNGFWVLQNKEANPLSSIITREIPPTTIQFEPNASGKILITTICYKDSQVETNQYTLEVKEPFLECDEDCEVLKPCECYVRGCKDGSFTAVLGNNVLKWKEKITTTDFVTSFISDKPGIVDVSVQCYDPMIYAEKEVPLGGEIRPTRVFSACIFGSTSLQVSYRIKLDYSNRLEEDVIIILTLSKNGKATNKKYVAEPGDGTANYLIDCEEFSGTYSVSWKAFKSSDRQNPIVWSKPEEMVTLTC